MGEPARICALAAALALSQGASARASAQGDPHASVRHVLAERARLLQAQRESAEAQARAQALLAYRLARRDAQAFLVQPGRRADNARARDQALFTLARGLDELRKLEHEAALLARERRLLEEREGAAPDRASGVREPGPGDAVASPALAWPQRGTLVALPGLRTDEMTGVELRQVGVQILTRLDAEVRAPAAGTVVRVEALGEGGYAVVIEHAGEWVSVLTGLRQVRVEVGDALAAQEPLGRVGRTLDGAPVLRFALFRGRQAVDPRQVLPRAGMVQAQSALARRAPPRR